MFVKPLTKYYKNTEEWYLVYQLSEIYRIDGYVRHRNIVVLDQLKELNSADEIKLLGKRIEEMITYGTDIILSENTLLKGGQYLPDWYTFLVLKICKLSDFSTGF